MVSADSACGFSLNPEVTGAWDQILTGDHGRNPGFISLKGQGGFHPLSSLTADVKRFREFVEPCWRFTATQNERAVVTGQSKAAFELLVAERHEITIFWLWESISSVICMCGGWQTALWKKKKGKKKKHIQLTASVDTFCSLQYIQKGITPKSATTHFQYREPNLFSSVMNSSFLKNSVWSLSQNGMTTSLRQFLLNFLKFSSVF